MSEDSEVFSNSGNTENNNNIENAFDDSQNIPLKTVNNSDTCECVKSESQRSYTNEITGSSEENAALENTYMFSKGIKPKEFEWNRYKNWEEASPLICNLFYCFYFPFICRVAPLREENIPQISDVDKSQLNTDMFRSNWEPVAKEYEEKMAEYERKKKINKKFVFILIFLKTNFECIYIYICIFNNVSDKSLKKPKYPSLLKIIFKTYMDWQLFFAVICLLISFDYILNNIILNYSYLIFIFIHLFIHTFKFSIFIFTILLKKKKKNEELHSKLSSQH